MPKRLAFPFDFQGVFTKIDPGSLQPGQLQEALNVTSIQQGNIQVRFGSKRLDTASGNLDAGLHTMYKMALGGADSADLRYIGQGASITRVTGPYSSYTDITTGYPISGKRWEGQAYSATSSGKPYFYFATPDIMLKDDGASSIAHPWGIYPPALPAVLGFGSPSLSVMADQSGGTNRLTGVTVTSATLVSGNYYQITPSDMSNILAGMYVRMTIGGSPTFVLVQSVTSTTFFAICASTPSGAIDSFYTLVNEDAGGSPVTQITADGNAYKADYSASLDWSFSGTPATGYSSADIVHVGLWIGSIAYTSEIRVRVYVNGSGSDYYEKAIAMPVSASYIAAEQAANAAAAAIAAQSAQDFAAKGDQTYIEVQPIEVPPVTETPTWYEYDIPKNTFLAVGQAGQGAFSWKNVSMVEIYVITNQVAGGPTYQVEVGAIYARGGQGPDSITQPTAAPYRYRYVYRNPVTGEIGNPSTSLVPENWIDVQVQAINVRCWGTDYAGITGNPDLQGFGSIAIYRAGGTFADALYRFVGYTSNPGVSSGTPLPVDFVDNQPDDAIAGNDQLVLDNFAPVPSDIVFAALTPSGMPAQTGLTTFAPASSGISDLRTALSPGGNIHIGNGVNDEDCIILSVTATQITIYLQRIHSPGENLNSDYMYATCDILCKAGDTLILAGDPNNPHKIYQSKSAQVNAYPPVDLEDGNAHIVNITTPDNPITGLVEHRGEIVVLCLYKIYTFQLWNGAIWNIQEAPVNRGMVAKHLWTRVGDSIWYLSYDGIYAWSGGESIKMTEAIDWVFNGQQVGSLAPLNYATLEGVPGQAPAKLVSHDSYVYFIYSDTSAGNHILRYHLVYKRWEPCAVQFGSVMLSFLSEKDTGRLIGAVFDNGPGSAYLEQFEQGTTESWVSTPTSGTAISFAAFTGFYAPESRTTIKEFTDIALEVENPSDNITVQLYYDYSSTGDSTDTFTIAPAAGRRWVPLPLQQTLSQSWGKEAKAIALRFTGSATAALILHGVEFRYNPLADIQRGQITDWMFLGHPYDKHLFTMTLEYDAKGQTITLSLDILYGVGGANATFGVQTFSLSGSGRSKQVYPLIDGLVVKAVRLRPNVASADFEIFGSPVFEPFEKYPPDVVYFTEYTDVDYAYDKYLQQIVFDVNTNGFNVSVQIQADGTTQETITVNTTLSTRKFTYTLNSPIVGKKFRILLTTPLTSGAMFQLWSLNYVVQPADKGAVSHTSDWDDLGYPYDKKLTELSMEYDHAGGALVVDVDTISGFNGTSVTTPAFTVTLTGTGRSKQPFAIADGQVVKMVRVQARGTNPGTLKSWKYHFDFIKYPPDISLFTDWSNLGWSAEKVLRAITLTIDTGGVNCNVALGVDGTTVQNFTVNTTSTDRVRILTVNPNQLGKMFNLVYTPGTGGKAQVFDVKWDAWREPEYLTWWDSSELVLGSVGFRFIKQIWVEYLCTGGITLTIYVSGNTQFYQTTLAAHSYRDTERFFLPKAVGSVLNKSKRFRFTIAAVNSSAPFKIYGDGSRIESLLMSGNQRGDYDQHMIWEALSPKGVA